MYTIGSYAIPQIQTVNPDMDIDSFVMPANNNTAENQAELRSRSSVLCYERLQRTKRQRMKCLDFLLKDENVQAYLDDQKAVPCKGRRF